MTKKPQPASSLGGQAMIYMVLLSIQFGLQPMLTSKFTPQTVCKSTVILVQEVVKFILAMSMLLMSGELSNAFQGEFLILLYFYAFNYTSTRIKSDWIGRKSNFQLLYIHMRSQKSYGPISISMYTYHIQAGLFHRGWEWLLCLQDYIQSKALQLLPHTKT